MQQRRLLWVCPRPKDAWIDENDVSHGNESRQAGEDFRFDGRPLFAQLENTFQYALCLGHGRPPVVGWLRMIPSETDNLYMRIMDRDEVLDEHWLILLSFDDGGMARPVCGGRRRRFAAACR